jgi:hypothetical protein
VFHVFATVGRAGRRGSGAGVGRVMHGYALLLLILWKISFGAYLTWIQFVFKFDIFKNNRRFGFILKDMLLK